MYFQEQQFRSPLCPFLCERRSSRRRSKNEPINGRISGQSSTMRILFDGHYKLPHRNGIGAQRLDPSRIPANTLAATAMKNCLECANTRITSRGELESIWRVRC